ncbi:hypothetical protein G6O69_09865 [Pseudenhygromyxa sp. WMMC2535]|uniref:helix-turn-helix domain-containing protein n=1 Tax=Pseudenhygromyxa sp. WMMC2535 TaxID=2712867 RepID=UPI0015544236|nr:helix-turn-helix domain-containing protein [Pseudenhygromyxa sp. WMMC2535]NVB38138.1 hypothetical protein [Pseudenhygromyxa sp. WMMC2535]
MPIVLDNLNLADAERKLCEEALTSAGSIVEAASLLGITRHALKRRIIKHQIQWPRPRVTIQRPVDNMLSTRPSMPVF